MRDEPTRVDLDIFDVRRRDECLRVAQRAEAEQHVSGLSQPSGSFAAVGELAHYVAETRSKRRIRVFDRARVLGEPTPTEEVSVFGLDAVGDPVEKELVKKQTEGRGWRRF